MIGLLLRGEMASCATFNGPAFVGPGRYVVSAGIATLFVLLYSLRPIAAAESMDTDSSAVEIVSDDAEPNATRTSYEPDGEMVLPAEYAETIFPRSCGPSCWTATLDALFLWRGNLQSQPLFTSLGGDVVIDANQAYSPVSVGPRIGIVGQLGCDHFIEGNYFYVDSFEGFRELPDSGGPFTLRDLDGLPPFEQITSGGIRTAAAIQSAEINWKHWDHSAVYWLAGIRWVEWNDFANVFYENDSPQLGENVVTETSNDLYGGQIGADVMVWNHPGPIRANVVAKAGVFFNDAFQNSSATVTVGDIVIPQGDVLTFANHTSFFGEITCNATWEINHWLAWRVGYTLFWLSGVATAPQQLAVVDIPEQTGSIDTEGSVLLHGATTGVEFRW